MLGRPLVCVVVPSYNRAHYLRRTLDSILGQDYPAIECIVADGGSRDGTVEILKSYGNRVRWVSEPDRGQSDAINKGWRMGRGEILTWLNADDVWEVPGAVRQAVDYLGEHPDVDVVYGDCGNIDREGRRLGRAYVHDWDLEYVVEHCDHAIAQPASFLRRSVLEKIQGVDTRFRIKMDHDLWLRIGLVGKIQYVPVLLAHACVEPGVTCQGPEAARACVDITRKFFSLPHVPGALQAKRRRALSNAYLRGVQYAWAGGRHVGTMVRYAASAVAADPSNTGHIVRSFCSFVTLPWRARANGGDGP